MTYGVFDVAFLQSATDLAVHQAQRDPNTLRFIKYMIKMSDRPFRVDCLIPLFPIISLRKPQHTNL